MRLARSVSWSVLIGALGGLVALEGHLACDLRQAPHYGLSLTPEICVWLLVGLVGPGLWLMLERFALLRRSFRVTRRPGRVQTVIVAMLAAALGIGASWGSSRVPVPESAEVPWRVVSAPWAVFLSAGVVSGIALFFVTSHPRLVRFFGWRVGLSVAVATSLYLSTGSRFELWPEYYWPGRL